MISDFAECSLGIRTIGGHLPARPFHCIGGHLLANFFNVLESSNPNSSKIVQQNRIKYGQGSYPNTRKIVQQNRINMDRVGFYPLDSEPC